MASLSDYMETLFMTYLKGVQFPTPPTLYAAVFSTNPTDGNIGTEVTFSIGGTRPIVTLGPTTDSADGKRVGNATDLTFTSASTGNATITHVGIYDAPTAGNLLMHGALTTPVSVNSGYAVKVLANQLSLTIK